MAVVAGALMASITDTKHLFFIMVRPHISDYRQLWRCMTWPLVYTNSTEVLFAAMTLYQLRVIERLWGSRKFAVSPPLESHCSQLLIRIYSHSYCRHCPIPFCFHRSFSYSSSDRSLSTTSTISLQDPQPSSLHSLLSTTPRSPTCTNTSSQPPTQLSHLRPST